MPRFSRRSQEALATAHPDLQRLFEEVIKYFDCIVLEGHRDKEKQERMVREGKSTLHYPESEHNKEPSLAVDVAPYPIDWEDQERFYYFAGFVQGVASQMGIPIRWGGDWDRDTEVHDQSFFDLPHFELET